MQEEVDSNASAPTTFGTLNRALHSIAAHLQRYGSELASMEETLSDIVKHHKAFMSAMHTRHNDSEEESSVVSHGLNEIVSHLRQVRAFLQELKAKLENILALVGHTRKKCLCLPQSIPSFEAETLPVRIWTDQS